MNRTDFQQLAEDRLRDAEALLGAGRWSGAYYLAGYAVECALKASIAKLTNEYDFPDKKLANDCYTHDINKLFRLAELEEQWERDIAANDTLAANWLIVKDWNEESRYQQKTQAEVESLFRAAADNENGVMQWIRSHW